MFNVQLENNIKLNSFQTTTQRTTALLRGKKKKTLECFCYAYAIEPSFPKFSSSQCAVNCIQCHREGYRSIPQGLQGKGVNQWGEVIREKTQSELGLVKIFRYTFDQYNSADVKNKWRYTYNRPSSWRSHGLCHPCYTARQSHIPQFSQHSNM